MAYNPVTFTYGEVLTVAQMQQLMDNDAYLKTEVDALKARQRVSTWGLSSNLSVATGTFTLVPATAVVEHNPTGSPFSNTGGAVTISDAGLYEVEVTGIWAGVATGPRRGFIVTLNSPTIPGSGVLTQGTVVGATLSSAPGSADYPQFLSTRRFAATTNDVLRLFAFQDSAGALNLQVGADTSYMGRTTMSIARVG